MKTPELHSEFPLLPIEKSVDTLPSAEDPYSLKPGGIMRIDIDSPKDDLSRDMVAIEDDEGNLYRGEAVAAVHAGHAKGGVDWLVVDLGYKRFSSPERPGSGPEFAVIRPRFDRPGYDVTTIMPAHRPSEEPVMFGRHYRGGKKIEQGNDLDVDPLRDVSREQFSVKCDSADWPKRTLVIENTSEKVGVGISRGSAEATDKTPKFVEEARKAHQYFRNIKASRQLGGKAVSPVVKKD